MELESWNSWGEMLRWPPAQSKRQLKNTALTFDVWYRSKTIGAITKHILAFWRSPVGKTPPENLERVPCGRCWSQNSTLKEVSDDDDGDEDDYEDPDPDD